MFLLPGTEETTVAWCYAHSLIGIYGFTIKGWHDKSLEKEWKDEHQLKSLQIYIGKII
jgi:hypothetical protein